jgi:MSHA biogenesis protein MshP
MCRKYTQQGAGLVAAIALIVIVALVALAVTQTVQFGASSVSLEVLSQRALQAATSGAQLGLNRVFAPAGVGTCTDRSWDFSGLPGLPACQAVVTCDSAVVRGNNYYIVHSTGKCAADTLQTERVVRVRATP